MLYGDLRKSVSGLLRGDNSKADEMLNDATYISMAIRDVSIRCVPLALLERWDETKTDVFRRVHSVFNQEDDAYDDFYIRLPIISIEEDGVVEIEEELIQAIIFFMCSYLSNKKQEDYVKRAEDVISMFNSNSVDLTQYEL
jgi:hypothetical protein